MSSINAIKQQLLEDRRLGNPHFSATPQENPRTEFIREKIRKESGKDTGFQCIPDKSEKKKVHRNITKSPSVEAPKSFAAEVLAAMNEDDSDDEKMEKEEEKKHAVAWHGPKLSSAYEVQNLDKVIESLNAPNVVFDNGKSREGKKSEKNFFDWVEEYCRLEHKKKKDEENRLSMF